MIEFYLVISVVCAVLVGMALGAWIEARSWRNNADEYRRKESGGRLFKVIHAKDWKEMADATATGD